MMRSLYSGISGLKNHQTRMDVIGNNIANVNTVGFKASSVNFSELFYQTTQVASGANAATQTGGTNAKQIGLGMSVAAISVNVTGEGGSQSTGNAFDIKINGGSFFIVNSGGSTYFTKAGNFKLDEQGNLVTPTGAYVMGFIAARNPETGDFEMQTDELRPISVYGEEYMNTAPAATTAITYSGNINAEDADFKDGGVKTTTVYAYDNLGNKYGVQILLKPVTKAATPDASGNYPENAFEQTNPDGTKTMVVPVDGQYSVTTGKIFLGENEVTTLKASFAEANPTLTFSGADGKLVSPTGPLNLVIGDVGGAAGTPNQAFSTNPISVDFSLTTNYGSKSTIDSRRGDLNNQGAGKAVGIMTSVGVQTDGRVVASYSNGDTVFIGQIRVANFDNPAGLEKVGDNLFAATMNSGEFNGLGEDVTAEGDSMSSGVLEMSNVDLSTEFTDMIVTQRGFQANSRIITTSDSLLEELVNLKR